jgi:hypothetical protein
MPLEVIRHRLEVAITAKTGRAHCSAAGGGLVDRHPAFRTLGGLVLLKQFFQGPFRQFGTGDCHG